MQGSDVEISSLVANFWHQKNAAVKKLTDAGLANTGAQARDARHMETLAAYVRQMFVDAGLDEHEVVLNGVIPGYYRRSKNWDVVATFKGNLVGVVELKSQVGSEGNNANNRIEEATGSARDVYVAQDLNAAFGKLPTWTAFCLVLGQTAGTQKVVGMRSKPLFPIDPVFNNLTYARQYQIAIERWVQTGAYSAGWMLTTWLDPSELALYAEPVPTATAATLAISIRSRVEFAKQVLTP